jgi:integrase
VDVEQLLAANPAARSKRPRSTTSEPVQVWTADQLGTFLAAARSHRLFAFYRLAAYTGARRGELLYLRWSAVNLDVAEVTFGGSTAVIHGQRVEGTTKGGRSRTVSLDRDTVTVLREHRRQQAKERLAAGSAWTDTDRLVFVTRWSEQPGLGKWLGWGSDRPVVLVDQLRHERSHGVGIKRHDLRHLHASALLLAGVPVHVVAARLGHADPAVTLRVYSHVLREHAASVGDIFAQAVETRVSRPGR